MSDCTNKLQESFPHLNPAAIAKYVSLLEGIKGGDTMGMGKFNAQAKKLLQEGKLQELLNLKAQVSDAQKMVNNKAKIFDLAKSHKITAGEALTSMLMTTNKKIKGSYNNFQGQYLALKSRTQSALMSLLKENNVEAEALSGKFDNEIANYIYQSANNGDVSKFSKEVKTIGDIFRKTNIHMALEQQGAGIPIAPKDNYLFTQNHNLGKILPDPKAWIESVLNNPDVDWENSFSDVVGEITFDKARIALEEMVNGFKFGDNHLLTSTGKTFGGGKVQLLFKTGEGFLNYNKEWGNGRTLLEGLLDTINKHSEKTTLVSMFGNNPISKLRELSTFSKKSGATATDNFFVDGFIDYIQGKGNFFADEDSFGALAFKKTQQAKGLANLALLGKSGFTSLLDIPTTALTLHTQYGTSIWKSTADSVSTFAKNMFTSKKARSEFLEYLEISMTDLRNEILETYGGEYSAGTLANLNEIFMKVNGTNFVTELTRTSAVELNAKYLTNVVTGRSSHSWDSSLLAQIGLTDSESLLLKNIAGNLKKGEILSPKFIRDSIEDLKVGSEISSKVSSFYVQTMFEGSPAPMIKEKLLMGKHLPKDHPMRIASEIGMQYKASMLRLYGNTSKYFHTIANDASMGKWNKFTSTAQVGFVMFSTAAAIQQISDSVLGKDREYDSNWIKEIARDSGMLGIYLDYALASGENRLAPPLVKAAFGVIGQGVNEVSYLMGADLPQRRRTEGRVIPMKFDNKYAFDRQVRMLEKALPNPAVWIAFKNHLLSESEARRKR